MASSVSFVLPRFGGPQVRVLVIPGLRNSEPGHWQSWLQTQYRGAKRVEQACWDTPDLDAWAAQIGNTIQARGRQTKWVAVAHSFGCLALARYIRLHRGQDSFQSGDQHTICSALMVAPADPVKFDVTDRLPQDGLGIPSTLIGSENDPWMPLTRAREWAHHWGARFHNLGRVGHINVDSGFGPWPLARFKVDQMIREQQRQRRIELAHPLEFQYAV